MELDLLFEKYQCDKEVNHGYTALYHTLFTPLRDQPVRLLEVGIGTMIAGVNSSMVGYVPDTYRPGGSLRAWRDYFPKGEVWGFDVQPDTQFSDEPRITTRLCNSTSSLSVKETMASIGDLQFDIIIDDGDHADSSQYLTLKNLYPHLRDGGLYIIEDVYPGSRVSTEPHLVSEYCNHDPYFFVGVKNNVCVIYKHHLTSKRMNY